MQAPQAGVDDGAVHVTRDPAPHMERHTAPLRSRRQVLG
jgi:hypothetical protein